VNLGSTAGHQTYPGGNVYCATKAAVRVISEVETRPLGTPVRVSSVDPGLVETEFSNVRFRGDTERAKQVYQGLTPPQLMLPMSCFLRHLTAPCEYQRSSSCQLTKLVLCS